MRIGARLVALSTLLAAGTALAQAPLPALPPRPAVPAAPNAAPASVPPAPLAPTAAAAPRAPVQPPVGGAPAIPVTPNAASPALPPPAQTAGQPNPPSPPAPGAPAAQAAKAPEPGPAVVPGPSAPKHAENELTRADYQKRLVDCLEYRAACSIRGLTKADQDFFRYEVRGQRFASSMISEIVDARMFQFGNALVVHAPKDTGNPEWRTARPSGEIVSAGRSSGFALAITDDARGVETRTRHVPQSRFQRPATQYDPNHDW